MSKVKRRPTIEADRTHKRQRSFSGCSISDADLYSLLSSSQREDELNLEHLLLNDFVWDTASDCPSVLSQSFSADDVPLGSSLSDSLGIDPLWQQCLSSPAAETLFYESEAPEALLLSTLYAYPTVMQPTDTAALTPPDIALHPPIKQLAPADTSLQFRPEQHRQSHSNCNSRAPLADAFELLCLPPTPSRTTDSAETDSAIGSRPATPDTDAKTVSIC